MSAVGAVGAVSAVVMVVAAVLACESLGFGSHPNTATEGRASGTRCRAQWAHQAPTVCVREKPRSAPSRAHQASRPASRWRGGRWDVWWMVVLYEDCRHRSPRPAQYFTVKLAFLAYLIHPRTKVSGIASKTSPSDPPHPRPYTLDRLLLPNPG